MNKSIINFILFAIFLVLISMPLSASYLAGLEEQNENEINLERILQNEIIQKDAELKAEKKIYLLGKFDPSTREDFAPVPSEYNIVGYKMYLRKETLDAFGNMAEAADKNRIKLKIASATRNFDYQKNLWNNKWNGVMLVNGKNLAQTIPDGFERFKKILEYSAAPGTSRHHWGTEIDFNAATPEYFETEKGEQVYEWLTTNAQSFGFCQTYKLKGIDRPTGYNEEKWHWSYLPLSKSFTQEYKNLITAEDIKGFDGDEYAPSIDLINDYVLGINPDCI